MTRQFKKGFLHEHALFLGYLVVLIDVSIISVVHFATLYTNGISQDRQSIFTLVFALAVFITTARNLRFYRSHRTTSIRFEVGQILLIWLVTVMVLAAMLFSFDNLYTRDPDLLRFWFLATPVLLVLSRLVVRGVAQQLRRMGRNFRNIGIIGATDMGLRIKTSIDNNRWMGLKYIGFFDERRKARVNFNNKFSGETVHSAAELFEFIAKSEIHIVYIALPMRSQHRIKALIEQLSRTGVSIYYAPDFDSFDLLHSAWDDLDGQPVISIVETPFLGFSNIAKRFQDLVLALCAIVLLAVPMLIVSLLIKLDSRGPIIYKQQRYGLDGKSFGIFKFRTMYDNAGAQVFVQAKKNDQRVTWLGKVLRAYSIDELPQLFNVLVGQMSMVGPRPHPIALDQEHQLMIRRYNLRFKVKPGITGWAQVNGYRGQTDTIAKMQQRIEYDLEYIKNWSFLLDIKILLLTVVSVLRPVNAY